MYYWYSAVITFKPQSWSITGLASIGRFVALAGEAGLVGMGIYSVVDDHSSAPYFVFGYIKVNKAAKARRAMGKKDLVKLDEDFRRKWPTLI
ncbi:hypothetical protein N7517_005630 [Penicillium concentricum]|uniref:Uncharacterized protein n=1 Tax=Penicillium concentricum TaxID=293559 RepID=A0A9W9SAJ5_9EURO|nr:uncharacterized protein N7517_005630 [Penicillium concentricum]KAJ5373624.1 hypothetical protein N7517_005630 [Penicillium concentricum]